MNIYKNFLPKKHFKKIQSEIMSDYIPWYYNNGVVSYKDDSFQLTFTFIKDGKYNCPENVVSLLKPILNKIKYKKINKIKAKMIGRTETLKEYAYHIDQPKGKTGIFYINNCNGYTKFKNGKKILSEENKYIEFNSKTQHTGSSCTDEKRRVVINFNYQ